MLEHILKQTSFGGHQILESYMLQLKSEERKKKSLQPCDCFTRPALSIFWTHHKVGDGVSCWGSGLTHRVMGNGSHPKNSGLLEHPAGQCLGQLHVTSQVMPTGDHNRA